MTIVQINYILSIRIIMNVEPNYAITFCSYTESVTSPPIRDLAININRRNTNQTGISIKINCLTSDLGYLHDETTDVMHHMLTYHDINTNSATSIVEATSNHVYDIVSKLTDYEGTNLRIIVNIEDYNPQAIHRIDVDIATINQEAGIRGPATDEEDEICTICFEKFGGVGIVNSLQCNHVFHHQCIVDWMRSNLSCPTCRLAII